MIGVTDLGINGSYIAYGYVILLEISILNLRRPACITANIFIPRLPRADQTAHVISVSVMILLLRAVLLARGIQTGI